MRDKQAREGRLRKIRVHLPLRSYLAAARLVLRRAPGSAGNGLAGLEDGADSEDNGFVDEQCTAPNVREGLPNQGVSFRKKVPQDCADISTPVPDRRGNQPAAIEISPRILAPAPGRVLRKSMPHDSPSRHSRRACIIYPSNIHRHPMAGTVRRNYSVAAGKSAVSRFVSDIKLW